METITKTKILVVGALLRQSDNKETGGIGGTTISLIHLIDYLKSRPDVEVTLLDANGIRGAGIWTIFRLISFFWRLCSLARKNDVITIHSNTTALFVVVPLGVAASWISGKPLVVRKFAGTDFMTYGLVKRNIILRALNGADLFLVQSKDLLSKSRKLGIVRSGWFATSRPMEKTTPVRRSTSSSCRRFVFLGRVAKAKGIESILSLDNKLPSDVIIDIYGPFDGDIDESWFSKTPKIRYLGISTTPQETMKDYDVFLLPTSYTTEGYPGAILEAYGCGLPVIATGMGAIPEIVDETTGILIEPNSSESLLKAILRFVEDEEYFHKLRVGVEKKRLEFSSDYWNNRFVEYCHEAIEQRNKKRVGLKRLSLG